MKNPTKHVDPVQIRHYHHLTEMYVTCYRHDIAEKLLDWC